MSDDEKFNMTLAKYLKAMHGKRTVPRRLVSRATKRHYRLARRAGKSISWSEAKARAVVWNNLCGRGL